MKKIAAAVAGATLSFIAAAVSAQDVAYADAQPAATSTGTLVAVPNPVVVTIPGGIVLTRTITVTNKGPGLASNLGVSEVRTQGTLAMMHIGTDTCQKATLASGGTCMIQLVMDGTCPKPETSKWNVLVTSTSAATLTIPVTVASPGGLCE